MDVLVTCRDALCSKEINKEELDLTTIFWLSLEIFRSNSKLSHLVQESERLDINLSKNWLEFQIIP